MSILNSIKSSLGFGAKETAKSAVDGIKILIGAAKETVKSMGQAIPAIQQGVQNTAVVRPIANLAKEVGQATARSVASLGLSVINPIEKIAGQKITQLKPEDYNPYAKALFGDEGVQNVVGATKKFQQEHKTLSGPGGVLAPAFVIGGRLLDITGTGGALKEGREALELALKNADTVDAVLDVFKKSNIPEVVGKEYAERFAKTTDTKVIKEGVDNLEKSIGEFLAKNTASEAVSTAEQTALRSSTEAAQQLPGSALENISPRITQQGGEALQKSIQGGGKKSIVEDLGGAVGRLSEAIKTSAKPARAELEAAYTAERSARATNLGRIQERGGSLPEQLGALKGELVAPEKKMFAKVEMIEQDIKSLMRAATVHPGLSVFEKLNTQVALSKVLQGVIPTNSELILLQKVYGMDLVKNILSKQSTGQKILDGLGQIVNLPRSVMSSFDLSAPFRQGLALLSHPKAFFKSFMSMFKQFGSEAGFKAVQESIQAMPDYELMKESRLAMTEVGSVLSEREERFMSNWAESIPGFGRVVKASGRAYVGFLNKLRADTFVDIINGVRASGNELSPELAKEIADFVNIASGRGSKLFGMIPVGQANPILNGLFFSPRLMASRTTLLNPVKYVTASPVVRKEMLKSLFTVLGSGMTMLGLAKMAGAEVGDDPTSSDFGKIKVGNTRIDIWGGFQQYVRMAGQLWTGKYTSTTTGKQYTLGEGYKPVTRWDILWRQIESKEAPIAAFVTALLRQQDYKEDPVSVTKEVKEMFTPMVVSGLYDIYKDDPELLPLGLMSIFGVGVQTYTPKSKLPPSKLRGGAQSKMARPKAKPYVSKLRK